MGMKVVIDIPKEAFESVKNDKPIDFLDAVHIISTIQNGIPLVEELEKLKAEFEEDKYILLNQITAIKVINNHIEELKGEN